jgi:hypothetical protein
VMELNKTEAGWWWLTQKGLILITFERFAIWKCIPSLLPCFFFASRFSLFCISFSHYESL